MLVMFRGYSSKKDRHVLFSCYLDYDLWEIMIQIWIGAILENKNMNTKPCKSNVMKKEETNSELKNKLLAWCQEASLMWRP